MHPTSPLATAENSATYIPGVGLAPGQTLAPPAAARGFPTLPELAHALKRRLVLATFLGLLVGTAAAAAVWLAMPSGKHQVRALLQVTPTGAGKFKQEFSEGQFDNFKQTQQRLLTGRLLLARVVAKPAVNKLNDIRNSDDPVRYLEEKIKIKWIAELMEISINGDDPVALQTILDALVKEYINDSNTNERTARTQTLIDLNQQLEKVADEIATREEKIKKLNVLQEGNPAPEIMAALINSTQAAVNEFERTRSALDSERRVLSDSLASIEARIAQTEATPIDPQRLDDYIARQPEFRKRVDEIEAADEKYKKAIGVLAGARLADKKAAVDQLRAALAQAIAEAKPKYAQRALEQDKAEAVRERADVAKRITSLDSQIKVATDKKEEQRKKLTEMSSANIEQNKVQSDLKPFKDRRDAITKEVFNLGVLQKERDHFAIKEDAHILLNQNLQQKMLLSVAALLAGTTALMLAVAFLEWRSRRVDSVDQVVNDLGLRVIGTIPAFPSKQALRSGDASQSQNWRFVLNESVNSARTMLLHTAKTQNMQVLMVTSAMQGEGKTSLASQLATSMATAGLRTLILDCDLRNPSMHKLFDAPLTPGCSEVLCQEIDVSDAVQPTTIPNLWLIPAGQCSNRVISSLAQGHPLETLFNRLRGQFDFIVVDSCPVLPVADSLLVGQHVDGVVISILQDISQLPKVAQVSERLTQLNIPLLGAVVNGVKPDIHAYGYNYVKQLPA